MNRFEIRDILNAHKEHFRVLPTLVLNELNGIIQTIDNDKENEGLMSYKDWEQMKMSEQKIKTLREVKPKKKVTKKAKGR